MRLDHVPSSSATFIHARRTLPRIVLVGGPIPTSRQDASMDLRRAVTGEAAQRLFWR